MIQIRELVTKFRNSLGIVKIITWIGVGVLGIGFLGVFSFNENKDSRGIHVEEAGDSQNILKENRYTESSKLVSESIKEFSKENPQTATAYQLIPIKDPTLVKVISVVDGDTIKVEINGSSETLRLIGMDTPETVDPRKPVQCFGTEASQRAKELLNGTYVRLEADISQGEQDKYGRTLSYVFLEDGTNFNLLMITQGYAYEYTYDTAYKYQKEFKEAQQYAQTNKLGLWSDGTCSGMTESTQTTPEPELQQTNTAPTQTYPGNYTCSSNAYNCDNFSSHDEAQYVYELCGGPNSDIHKLDRDGDGLACESI